MAEHNSRIAVIGIGCRFAGGADDPEKLWTLLAEGRSARREVPQTRWNGEAFYHPDPTMKESLNWKHGYFLDQDLSAFDSRFFDVPPREAAAVDPQQRLLLETTYEALEQAGLPLETLRGSDTSVHMAIFARDYDHMGYRDGAQLPHLHVTGAGDAILAARISYFFDLKGPCNTLDTGCSGSAVAIHQACEALRAGRSRMAIAGSSQLLLHPEQSIALSRTGVANDDGQCYVFDDRGKGYGRGEGVAVLVLKPLDLALSDGDPIQAIIVETGVNHDGRTKGIFLPNADAQETLARSVYARAGLDPCKTLYVEAHGTGTVVGDDAEVQSISRVFGEEAGRNSAAVLLRIGSIKANIGHLEASSGMSGVIKSILMLRKNQIPPQLNFVNPKPSLHLEERKIEIVRQLTPLTPEGYTGPRRISVNSFGYGGTNAHIILEGPEITGGAKSVGTSHLAGGSLPDPCLVVLSANSDDSLNQTTRNLLEWLRLPENRQTSLQDMSYTLCTRRSILNWRYSVVANSLETLEALLQQPNPVRKAIANPKGDSQCPSLAFVFTGQGAQWAGMGRELLTHPGSQRFRESISKFSRCLAGLGCDWNLETELSRGDEESRLGDALFSQPATTAVQVALVDLLASWGIRPNAVCGHSSGEIAAAYAAGVLDMEAAARVSYFRGVVSSQVAAQELTKTGGAMLAVGEGEDAVTKRILESGLNGRVVVACVNSPQSTTVSGDADAVDDLARLMDTELVWNRRLRVGAAYHSHHMSCVQETYLALLQGLHSDPPRNRVVFISSVTASRKTAEFGASYWVSNLVSQVKFSAAAQLLAEELRAPSRTKRSTTNSTSAGILLEVGPHSALEGPLRQSLEACTLQGFKHSYIPCLVRKKGSKHTMLDLAGRLFSEGCPVQLDAVLRDTMPNGQQSAVITTLPTYAWDHSPLPGSKKLWTESRLSKSHRLRPFPYHDLLGLLDVASAPLHEPRWRFHVSLQTLPWLVDHVVDGFVIFPGAAYLAMVIEAAKQYFWMQSATQNHNQPHSESEAASLIKAVHMKDVTFDKPVVVNGQDPDGTYPEIELVLSFSQDRKHKKSAWQCYRILSYNPSDASWTEHSTGAVLIEVSADLSVDGKGLPLLDEVEGAREQELAQEAALNALKRIRRDCSVVTTAEQFYNRLAEAGNTFGHTFQGVRSARLGQNAGTAEVVVPDVSASMPSLYVQPHTIHPSALDAVTQLQAQLFQRQFGAATVMPVSIAEFSIAADIDARPGARIEVAIELTSGNVQDAFTSDTRFQDKLQSRPGEARSALGRLWAFQQGTPGDKMRNVITATGMRLRAVGDADSTYDSRSALSRNNSEEPPFHSITSNNSRLEWRLDVDMVSQKDFWDFLLGFGLLDVGDDGRSRSTSQRNITLSDQVATFFIRSTLQNLRELDGGLESARTGTTFKSRPHLHKLLDWMMKWDGSSSSIVAQTELGLGSVGDDRAVASLIEKNSAENAMIQALALIGPRLVDIFFGRADALELLLRDNLLERIYADDLATAPCAQMAAYIQLLAHKYPEMKVIEVGAGTGGATRPLLESLDQGDGRLLLESYTFTDISSGFFERARHKFSCWRHQMAFATLDVARDPVDQGFLPGSYDLVVASNVLHATPSIDVTLGNVRRLLKPGGLLVIVEVTRLTASINVVFGNLEGWWMSNDGRSSAHSPLLSVSQWDSVLKHNMFSGADLAIPDHVGDTAFLHLIVSRNMSNGDEAHHQGSGRPILNDPKTMNIFLGNLPPGKVDVVGQVQKVLGQKEVVCDIKALGSTVKDDTWETQINFDSVAMVVDLAEPNHALLENPSPVMFDRIRRLLTQTRNLIWLSLYSTESGQPLSAMVTGLARVARQEHTGFRFIAVTAREDSFNSDGWGAARHIGEICLRSFWPGSPADQAKEWEYLLLGSQDNMSVQVQIPRLVPDRHFAEYVVSAKPDWARLEKFRSTNGGDDDEAELVECRYLNRDRPLQLEVPTPGLLSSMRFVDNDSLDDSLHGQLGPDEIQIEARAYGLNFKDVLIALGQLPPENSMSSEVCGVVTAVGSDVAHLFRVGDRVIGAFAAPFGSHLRANGWGFYTIPDCLSFAEGASIPIVFYTAWYCLRWVARLQRNQTVLIHAASGGVGQAAIQFAQLAGAEIFCTVGSAAKKQLIRDRYGIPESHILSSRAHSGSSRSFKKAVLRLTRGRGVDVVLNSLSGDMLAESWDCVAPFGYFVEIGKTDIISNSQLSMAPFDKHVTFASVDLALLHQSKPKDTREGMAEILDLFAGGILKPVYPLNTYAMADIQDAFRLMAARKHMGKQVLVADQDTLVRATRPARQPRAYVPLQLNRQGTYVVGGGLGDLGRRISRFLASRGAGHIVTLSRRRLDANEGEAFRETISKLGATLHIVQCDMADEDSVQKAAAAVMAKGLPPVRGILQAGLVLRDSMLEFMSPADYAAALAPKVRGTINLDKFFCTPESTVFFIMLSSMAGIVGIASQSNYCAGNAFQDAFAQARAQRSGAQGLQYISINVGAVQGSEQVAQARGLRSGLYVSFDELLTTLEYAMGPQAREDGAVQCIMRLDVKPWARLGAHGDSEAAESSEGHLSNPMLSILDSISKAGKAGRMGADAGEEADKDEKQRVQDQAKTAGRPGEAAAQATSVTEAESIVAQAAATKFTAFVGQDVAVEAPIGALGLDSLVSIELKNWIVYNFKVKMQASEVTSAQSILALSRLIVSRMNLRCNDRQPSGDAIASGEDPLTGTTAITNHAALDKPQDQRSGAELDGPVHRTSDFGLECCKASQVPPVRPIPDLNDAISFWIETSSHLWADKPNEWEAVLADLERIRAPDSPGRLALDSLLAEYGDGSLYSETLTKANWLQRRELVSAVNTHTDGKVPHTQAERAAIIARAVVDFRADIQRGAVKPLRLSGKPVCTWAWRFLFKSVREPRRGRHDETVRYDDCSSTDHLVVLRKGRVFKITLSDEQGAPRSFGELVASFDAILRHIPGNAADQQDEGEVGGGDGDADIELQWTGMLTTDDRDSWADMRQKLIGAGNAAYLHAIESAVTVINLDTCSPQTDKERARQVHHKDGRNRWFDKPLQFAVGSNGTSCVIIEHSRLDGLDVTPLWERIANAISSYSSAAPDPGPECRNAQPTGPHGSVHEHAPLPPEVALKPTPELQRHISTLKQRFLQLPASQRQVPYRHVVLHELGIDVLLEAKTRIKSVLDATYLLAQRLFFGRCPAAVTPVGMGHFHRGRVEIVLTMTPAVRAFCEAAATAEPDLLGQAERSRSATSCVAPGADKSQEDLAVLLRDAAAQLAAGDHAHTSAPCRSHVRVFELLTWLWNQEHQCGRAPPPPRFLADRMYRLGPGGRGPRVNGQTMGFEARLGAGHALYLDPKLPDSYFWAVLLPDKDCVRVSLCAGSDEAACAMDSCLHRAANIVRHVLHLKSNNLLK